MSNKKISCYNDGVIYVYREKDRKTDFNAKKNVSTIEDMDFVVRLAYEQVSKRQQDLEFAEKMGFSLSLKVKTRFVPGVDNHCKAVINGYLYDVSYLDFTKEEMWFYLEGVRKLDA